MTPLADRPNTALLVVDVQNAALKRAHERGAVVANVGSLVERARREGVRVVWVQHSDEQLTRANRRDGRLQGRRVRRLALSLKRSARNVGAASAGSVGDPVRHDRPARR